MTMSRLGMCSIRKNIAVLSASITYRMLVRYRRIPSGGIVRSTLFDWAQFVYSASCMTML